MATPSKSTPILSSDSLEQKGKNMTESNANMLQCPLNQQLHSFSDGPVAILWDIENCPVPSDVRPEDVAGNIRMALRVHPVIKGAVMMFSAYGDFNAFPRRLREGCQRTGVKLIDVPNGRKDAADKAILVDMFLFALDNLPPSSIMLISGDVDFAPALHILGQRGYTVILVIPGGVGVSSALCNAGEFVWDWPSMARGEGFVPPSKALVPPRGGPIELTGYLMGCHINDNSDGQNEEESIVCRGMSQNYYNSRDFSVMSQSLSEYNCGTSNMSCLPTTGRSHSLPSGLNDVSGGAFTLGAMDSGRGRGRASLPRGRGRSSSMGMRWSPRPHSHSQIPSPSPSPTPSPSPVVVDEVSDSGSSNSWPIKDGRKTSHQNSALASGSHNNKKHNSPDALGTCSPPLSSDCEMLLSYILNKLTISETSRPPHSHDHNSQSNSKSSAEEEQEPPMVVLDPPFDICPPKPTATVVLKPPLLLKNRERRNDIKRKNNQGTVLRPGMVLLKDYLSLTDQVKIVKRCRKLGLGCGGFYQPGYREGTKLHLKMMCLGKNWDPLTGQYGDHRTSDGAVPPDIPVDFHHLIDKAIRDSHALIQQLSQTTTPHNILPSMSSNICIVNFYSQNGRLGLHQDKDESEESLSQGLPVVSFSIGDSADFLYGDERDVDKAQKVVLESGDVLIFGGRSRNVFHGVTAIHPMTAPKLLLEETNLRSGRLNLTFRQY